MSKYPKSGGTTGLSYIDIPMDWRWTTRWTLENSTYITTAAQSTLLKSAPPACLWHLNDNTGTTTVDSSGGGKTGTLSGAAWDAVNQKLGASCLYFHAATDMVTFASKILPYERTDSFSISMWVKITAAATGYFLCGTNLVANNNGITLQFTGGGTQKLHFRLQGSNGTKCESTDIGPALDDGAWHHIVFTYAGTSLLSGCHVYVDSIDKALPATSDNLTATIITTSNGYFGARSDGYACVNPMRIDEVRIYSSVLTQANVNFLYNAGAGTESTTVMYPLTGYYAKTAATGQLNTANYSGIYSIKTNEVTPANTQVKYLISVDGGTTYKEFSSGTWNTCALANIHTSGMSKATLEALTDYSALFVAGTLDVACGLKTTDNTVTPQVNQILVRVKP